MTTLIVPDLGTHPVLLVPPGPYGPADTTGESHFFSLGQEKHGQGQREQCFKGHISPSPFKLIDLEQVWSTLCHLSHFWGYWFIDFPVFEICIRIRLFYYRAVLCKSSHKTLTCSRRQSSKNHSYFQCLDHMFLSLSALILQRCNVFYYILYCWLSRDNVYRHFPLEHI